MRPRLADTVRAVTDTVTRATPVFAEIRNPKFDRDVRTAVQVALERFLDLVGTDQPALPHRVRGVFVALGAAEAREDRGPEALLAAVRMAARVMLRSTAEALAQVHPVDPEVLIDLADAINVFVDELAAASTDGFALQLREQAGEGDRRRHQLAELLLRGSAPPSVVDAAAAGIGWRELDRVVPVLLPVAHAREARFRYGDGGGTGGGTGGGSSDGVVVERGRDAVLLLRAGPRAARPRLAEELRGRGAVVGPALGWAQLPAAVHLAELTAELTGGTERDDPAPVFADDQLAALALRGEPGALAVLSARRLARFADLPPARRENLLVTLESWLRHWGSRTAVATELFVRPQTVSYRLGRVRELLGADLDDPAARFELQLVLAARREAPYPRPEPGRAHPGQPETPDARQLH